MKAFYLFLICCFAFFSCASSQQAAYLKEAKKKVSALRPLIELSDEQAAKMIDIETEYLKATKTLQYSSSYKEQRDKIADVRLNKIKELLRRDQYVKFDVIENKRIKPTPIRVQ